MQLDDYEVKQFSVDHISSIDVSYWDAFEMLSLEKTRHEIIQRFPNRFIIQARPSEGSYKPEENIRIMRELPNYQGKVSLR